MNKIFILLLQIKLLIAQNQWDDHMRINPPYCGIKKDSKSNKIVGGHEAMRGEWPWQIAMRYKGGFICGGSLVNSKWILTAAHCVVSTNPRDFTITTGLYDLKKPEIYTQIRHVSKIITHPEFSDETFSNDIALMKINTKVLFSNVTFPVCVPTSSMYYSDVKSTATGWGSLVYGGPISRYLMEVEMPLLNDTDCLKLYPTIDASKALCAGNTGLNKDTCQGDSGGPLVVEENRWIEKKKDSNNESHFYLAGITSWGDGCGNGGVYTRTSNYYDWIRNTIKENS